MLNPNGERDEGRHNLWGIPPRDLSPSALTILIFLKGYLETIVSRPPALARSPMRHDGFPSCSRKRRNGRFVMNQTVLIADSDAELCELYRCFLTERGYEVETSSDGLDCMRKLRQ